MMHERAHDDFYPQPGAPVPGALALLGMAALILRMLTLHLLPRLASHRCPAIDGALLDIQRGMVVLAAVAWRDVEANPHVPASVDTEVAGEAVLAALARLSIAMARLPRPRLRPCPDGKRRRRSAAPPRRPLSAPRPATTPSRPRDGPAAP